MTGSTDISQARNFRKVNERLLTSGQPNESQLASARAAESRS